jgi:putative glutamine amidotransferase
MNQPKSVPITEIKPAKFRVGIAYPAFFGSFQKIFPDLEIVKNPDNIKGYDLIIFSGGEDVNPALYGRKTTYAVGLNPERDMIEKRIAEKAFGNVKMLGVCRGLQILSVLLGYKLVQDLYNEKGVHHGSYHPLKWHTVPGSSDYKNKMGLPDMVNSMHHQGVAVDEFPTYSLTPLASYSGIVELAVSDSVILTQFHPEFMSDKMGEFFKYVREWVTSGVTHKSPSSKLTNVAEWYSSAANPVGEIVLEDNNEERNFTYVPPTRANSFRVPLSVIRSRRLSDNQLYQLYFNS